MPARRVLARGKPAPKRTPPRPPGPAFPLAGVDEAGRGPVLGPLVVAGVLVADEAPLRDLGVKDSKQLTPRKREELAPRIRALATKVAVRVVEPGDLDRRMGRASLNVVEEETFADVLRELAPERAVLDACDVDAARFGANVKARLLAPCDVVSAHKADDRFPVVAAASIVAKVERDRIVRALEADVGVPIGSGYSHDPITQGFLKDWVTRTGDLPPFARRRWETSSKAMNRSLMDYSEFTG